MYILRSLYEQRIFILLYTPTYLSRAAFTGSGLIATTLDSKPARGVPALISASFTRNHKTAIDRTITTAVTWRNH